MSISDSIGYRRTAAVDPCPYALPACAESQNQVERAVSEGTGAASHNLDESNHLRPLRTSGTRPPLICVFPGSPGARDMADFLPEDQPIYEIYWPNMDGKTSFPTVEELAETFIQDLRKAQIHGPYQFCGYSTFGLVAYEMARLLLSQGENVVFLALFDIWHPKFFQKLTPRELVRYRAMRIIDRLGKYGRVLSQGRFDDLAVRVLSFLVRRGKSIVWRATRSMFRVAGGPVPKTMQVIESIASNQSYTPKPYPKRFILIRAKDFLARMLDDQTVGWHVCATEGVDVYLVQADHGTMIEKPYVRSLVEEIAPYLASPP